MSAKPERAKPDEFTQGFASAVASLARELGQPSMALDIMTMSGFSFDDFLRGGVDGYDLAPLREEAKMKKWKRRTR